MRSSPSPSSSAKERWLSSCTPDMGKASGPDNMGGRLLKSCSVQPSFVFSKLFSWLLKESKVPSIWKNAVICPVPKSCHPSQCNDYRPVALTSIVMKYIQSSFSVGAFLQSPPVHLQEK